MKPIKQNTHTLTIVLFAIYMLVLTGIILFKLPFYSAEFSDGNRIINLIPLQGSYAENGSLVWREIIGNVLLFIPLGIYICMFKIEWSLAKKMLPIFGLTLAFEVTQFIFALGRTDITDIIDNTFGGVIGIGIFALLRGIFKGRTGKIVNLLALALTVCVGLRFGQLFYLSYFVMGGK
jgi:glycopeptide antibiotics resistance protein